MLGEDSVRTGSLSFGVRTCCCFRKLFTEVKIKSICKSVACHAWLEQSKGPILPALIAWTGITRVKHIDTSDPEASSFQANFHQAWEPHRRNATRPQLYQQSLKPFAQLSYWHLSRKNARFIGVMNFPVAVATTAPQRCNHTQHGRGTMQQLPTRQVLSRIRRNEWSLK